jgi:hypothetical protein
MPLNFTRVTVANPDLSVPIFLENSQMIHIMWRNWIELKMQSVILGFIKKDLIFLVLNIFELFLKVLSR